MKIRIEVYSIYFRCVLICFLTKASFETTESDSDIIMEKQNINLPLLPSKLNLDKSFILYNRAAFKNNENPLSENQIIYLEKLIKQKLIDPLKKFHLSSSKYR
jgi:hypothetical protein